MIPGGRAVGVGPSARLCGSRHHAGSNAAAVGNVDCAGHHLLFDVARGRVLAAGLLHDDLEFALEREHVVTVKGPRWSEFVEQQARSVATPEVEDPRAADPAQHRVRARLALGSMARHARGHADARPTHAARGWFGGRSRQGSGATTEGCGTLLTLVPHATRRWLVPKLSLLSRYRSAWAIPRALIERRIGDCLPDQKSDRWCLALVVAT